MAIAAATKAQTTSRAASEAKMMVPDPNGAARTARRACKISGVRKILKHSKYQIYKNEDQHHENITHPIQIESQKHPE